MISKLDITYAFGTESVKYKSISLTIEKLNPMEFAALPTSNEHNRWQQIPGFRVIMRNVKTSQNAIFAQEMAEFITLYTKHLSDNRIFKKYKIR